MYEAFRIFIISTIAVTFWTAFLLVQDKQGNKLLNRWFAAFLVALTTPQMDLYASHYVPGGVETLALVAATFLLLKGPFVWTFIRVLTREGTSLRRIWWHFVPWFISLVVLLAFPRPQVLQSYLLFGMCHMCIYLLCSLWRLANTRRFVAGVWQGFQNSAYYWLLYVIGGLMALVVIDLVVLSLVTAGKLTSFDLLDYYAFPTFSVYVLSVAILSVYRPKLLFRSVFDDDQQGVGHSTTPDALVAEQAIHPKERYLELGLPLAQSLMKQLTQLMQEQQIYRQNELSLPDLALALGISVHQVSELLNVHCGTSFYDYINGYRFNYARDLLNDPNCQLRILDIAFEAGFNNKNSFYRTFKENLGVTPNQYRSNAFALTSPDTLTSV